MNTHRQKPTSFTASVSGSRADCIYLVRGHDITGRAAWYYIMVDKPKKRIFEVRAKQGQLELTDYGKILASGYGESVPPATKQRMEDEYGFKESASDL
jgi:hypothetical protein